MNKIPLTPRGARMLRNELMYLISNERPTVIDSIAAAREHGDLKENAEYQAAREKQSLIEGRIKEIEAILSRAQVIDPKTLSGNIVKFGATISIIYLSDKRRERYQLVGTSEADIAKGKLSIASPAGRALIGKSVGDIVVIKSPKGDQECQITTLEYL